MSSEEGPGTLAAQAAAWVPPWARRPVGTAAAEDRAGAAEDRATVPEDRAGAVEPSGSAEPVEQVRVMEPPAPRSAPEVAHPGPVVIPEPAVIPEPVVAAEPAVADEEEPDLDGAMAEGELRAAIEAILLVVDEPVTEMVLAQVLGQPTERVAGTLGGLATWYTEGGRGFDLRRVAGGWRLYTRPEYARYVERFVLDGQHVRMTQAALETLAVVAYKQPVTRGRISAIRGVNCDGVVRTLVARGLIEVGGTEPETGAFLYRTTSLFLEKLGVDGVDQLPPLAPFLPDDVEEIADVPR